MQTDSELLAVYRASRSESAFAEIVARHGSLVYSTCLRSLNNVQEAEDAAQTTFFKLSQCEDLGGVSLGLWLYNTARATAFSIRRARTRRVQRERSAARVRERIAVDDRDSNQNLAGTLDEALERLPSHFREAIILRFLENRGVAEAASLSGRAERTFALHTSQALERLRKLLVRRGGEVVSASLLVSVLTQESSVAIPAKTLAAMKAAGAPGYAPAASVSKSAAKHALAGKTKVVLALIVVASGTTGLVAYQYTLPAAIGTAASVASTASNGGQDSPPGPRLHKKWTFEKAPDEFVGEQPKKWNWQPPNEREPGKMVFPLLAKPRARVLLPVSIPARPVEVEIKGNILALNGLTIIGLDWYCAKDEKRQNPRKVWLTQSKINQTQLLFKFYLFGDTMVTFMNGRVAEVFEFLKAYPCNQISLTASNAALESIEIRELRPEEIPEEIRDTKALIQKAGLTKVHDGDG